MDQTNILIWGRVVERLIITLFAGASLLMGWNLFRLGIIRDQTAEFASGSWTVKLQKVGPGVFFALFGALVLAVALQASLQVPAADSSASDEPANNGPIIKYWGGATETHKSFAKAANTFEQLLSDDLLTPLLPRQKLALNRAIEEILVTRDQLVTHKFGTRKVQIYHRSLEDYLNDPSLLPSEERDIVTQLLPWLTDTFILEE